MIKTKFNTKKKSEILKKVLKKTNQYFEEAIHTKEENELDKSLENELDNI